MCLVSCQKVDELTGSISTDTSQEEQEFSPEETIQEEVVFAKYVNDNGMEITLPEGYIDVTEKVNTLLEDSAKYEEGEKAFAQNDTFSFITTSQDGSITTDYTGGFFFFRADGYTMSDANYTIFGSNNASFNAVSGDWFMALVEINQTVYNITFGHLNSDPIWTEETAKQALATCPIQ